MDATSLSCKKVKQLINLTTSRLSFYYTKGKPSKMPTFPAPLFPIFNQLSCLSIQERQLRILTFAISNVSSKPFFNNVRRMALKLGFPLYVFLANSHPRAISLFSPNHHPKSTHDFAMQPVDFFLCGFLPLLFRILCL